MSTSIKCSSCNATLPPLSMVCEYCGTVNSAKTNSNESGQTVSTGVNLVDLVTSIEDNISQIKQMPKPSLMSFLIHNSLVSGPIFTLASLLLSFKTSEYFLIAAVGFLFYTIFGVFKKKRNKFDPTLYKTLLTTFDTNERQAQTYFGSDRKTNDLINSYGSELKLLKNSIKKNKALEWVGYAIVLIVLVVSLIAPEPKTATQKNKEVTEQEQTSVQGIRDLINKNQFEKAQAAIQALKSDENKITLLSEMQLIDLKSQLDAVKGAIEKGDGDVQKIQNDLKSIKWSKISTSLDLETIEQAIFMKFVDYKKQINELLPANNKIDINDEIEF